MIKINWEGSLFVHHSLGMVNRELLAELIKCSEFDIRAIPYEQDQFTPDEQSKYHPLTNLEKTPHSDADVHIRHRWPPDFSPPPSGKLVLMQPWEYGSLPVTWKESFLNSVDEIWVYTRYLKICYERSGIPAEKVKVVPLGIDPVHFNPDAPPAGWITDECASRFRFLFNGGVTTRKGTDILINAYLNEFKADEPVCLIIKDSNVYLRGMARKVRKLAQRNDIAKIVHNTSSLNHDDLPGLYTACNCYVHPYRAEGYGLPIAEAMACDIPVIVTGGGACLDFVNPDTGYFIKCSLETMRLKQVSSLETVDYPFWLTPDMGHLQSLLRYVFTNREKAIQRGKEAGTIIRSIHTWENAAHITGQRIHALCDTNVSTVTEDPELERNAQIDQAISLLQVGSYSEAVSEFQKILLKYGENSLAYEGLAIAAFYRENYDEACNLFSAANRLSEDTIDIIINWYEAAKMINATEQLANPVRKAMKHHRENDELRSIAVDIGIL